MKILITGSRGFVGKNLMSELRNRGYDDIYEYTRDTSEEDLDQFTRDCEFVYHLAGVNRPKDKSEFMKGNFGFTSTLLSYLEKNNNKAPILISSSIQAELDNPYGKSKKAGEELIFEYGRENGVKTLVYRFPNLFGKWSKPNYNSVVATFCYNASRDIGLEVKDRDTDLTLCYIDDVVDELIRGLQSDENRVGNYCKVPIEHNIKVGKLADTIRGFREARVSLEIPDLSDPLTRKLYSTYMSFAPVDDFSYNLDIKSDERGSFMEFIRSESGGQVSINITSPDTIKGMHWHRTKHEKFLVISGSGVIRFKHLYGDEIIEYQVDGKSPQVVNIPPGYIHSLENIGKEDLITVMWASELYDGENPDTYNGTV